MKRFLNICLLLTFLLGYIEWGKTHSLFIFQAEAEIFVKGKNDFKTFLHPLILIPFLGQLIILYTIFQKIINRTLSLIGLTFLSILMLLLLVIGILNFNVKITGSTLPFVITGIFVLRYNRKRSPKD